VFTAVIGMFLATPGVVPLQILLAGISGIWLVAGAAAAVNCLVEQKIDAVMTRTNWRPLPQGELSAAQTLAFAGVLGGAGLWLLYHYVNALTMWLTLGTFVGYAVVYTVILKPATPQNIVIGGASGAMPPVLGWAAVTGQVTIEPLVLFLIVFAWTPPHFWSLALYRTEDYARAGVPMLPVTHGKEYTRLQVLLYTLILFAASLMPYVIQMAGAAYLAAAVALGGIFVAYAWRIYRSYSDALAQRTFRYSIVYLAFLFAALLVDHYL
jgi:protoheme IX farnesyltransferase